jgi:transcription elongation factor Elf1
MQLLCLVLFGLGLAAATYHLRQPTPVRRTGVAQRYWYCPECGLELALPAEADPKQKYCPHCGPNKPMQVNSFSRTNGEAPSLPTNRWFVGAMFGIPVALAVGLYAVSRARGGVQNPESDREAFQFDCPGCGHTIISNSYRKGSTAVCPACAELFVVTKSIANESAVDRSDKARDLEDQMRSTLRKKSSKGRKPPRA